MPLRVRDTPAEGVVRIEVLTFALGFSRPIEADAGLLPQSGVPCSAFEAVGDES